MKVTHIVLLLFALAFVVLKFYFIYVNVKLSKRLRYCGGHNLVGNVTVIREDILMEKLEMQLPQVKIGGRYSPNGCFSNERIAIIMPMRDREKHLRIWLRNMHPFLIRQERNYRIYVIEQSPQGLFNRGKLLNIGFKYALRDGYNCFIFHDIDTLPESDLNIYACESQPTHLSKNIQKFHYRLFYNDFFSGVIALNEKQFKRANGFSNKYYGWGGEDDDFYARVKASGMKIFRKPDSISRFASLTHKESEKPTRKRNEAYYKSALKSYKLNKSYRMEGFSTLTFVEKEYNEFKLYTRILVKL